MRTCELTRKTKETDIRLSLNIDGVGQSSVITKIGFFDHMLEAFAKHSSVDLMLTCEGDLNVDFHHSVEDTGIVLGQAFAKALGDKKGIERFGFFVLPMDEALVMCSLDFSGRGLLVWDSAYPGEGLVGEFDFELLEEFFRAFAVNAGLTLNMKLICGNNLHHIAEASFKALAKSLAMAVKINPDKKDILPSTKGVL